MTFLLPATACAAGGHPLLTNTGFSDRNSLWLNKHLQSIGLYLREITLGTGALYGYNPGRPAG